MSFNPDSPKQAQELSLSRKLNKALHLPLSFSNSNLTQVNCQKYVGMILDNRLTFNEYLEKNIWKS